MISNAFVCYHVKKYFVLLFLRNCLISRKSSRNVKVNEVANFLEKTQSTRICVEVLYPRIQNGSEKLLVFGSEELHLNGFVWLI